MKPLHAFLILFVFEWFWLSFGCDSNFMTSDGGSLDELALLAARLFKRSLQGW